MHLTRRDQIDFAVVYFAWGLTYAASKLFTEGLDPIFGSFLRYVLAGSFLAVTIFLFGLWAKPSKGEVKGACFLGLFIGFSFLQAIAVTKISTGLVALIFATVPLWAALFDRLTGRGGNRKTVLVSLVGVFGLAIIFFEPIAESGQTALIGIGLALINAIAWAWMSSSFSNIPRPKSIGASLMIQTWTAAGLILIATLLFSSEPLTLEGVPFKSWAGLIYAGILGSVFALWSLQRLLAKFPSPAVSSYTFVNPLVAVIVGVVLFSEPITISLLVGSCLIVASAFYLLIFIAPSESEKTDSLSRNR